jgi:hypothetical protein
MSTEGPISLNAEELDNNQELLEGDTPHENAITGEEDVLKAEDSEEDDWQPPKTVTDKALTFDVLAPGLCLLGRTGNGLSHAYIRLQLNGKSLTSVEILDGYPHIRFLVKENPTCSWRPAN